MLNEESRKYFHRGFSMSGSAFQSYVLWDFNRTNQIPNCTHTNDTKKMIEYLKTANASVLLNNCSVPEWIPTIESSHVKGAFLTESPEKIYNSTKAPIMDAMFSFTSKVNFAVRFE